MHGPSIYGNQRTQRIASASSSHMGASAAGSAAAMSGSAAVSRKTIYGSAGLSGLGKSGFNNSTPSLGSTATGFSSGVSEHLTIGRKGPPPPENPSANNNQHRDYSFAIAGGISKSTSNGSTGSANAHGVSNIACNNNANSGNNDAGTASNATNFNAKSARSSAGASVPIAKEGYLSKKTDINPSTSLASALSRGWKVYRVVLKGAKLFFYKPPSESELRAMFPEEIAAATNETAGGYVRASFSASGYEDGGYTNSSGFPMSPGEVDSSSRAMLFEPGVHDGEITVPLSERYVFGECFTEVDLRSLKFKRYVSVLIFDDTIVVLKRRWVRQGIASSFFGAVSNKMRFGKGSRTKAHQVPDNSSLVSAELGIKGKGYFTKWKYHSQYPLTNVEAIEAASSRFSVAHAPGMLGHIGRESQAGSSRVSLYSIGNSSVSSVMTRTSTVSKDYSGALSSGLVPGFQIFVGGKERVARMFVATTSDAKNNWLSRFTAAKASYARKLRQRPRENSTGARRYNGAAESARRPTTSSAVRDTSGDNALGDEKPKTAKDTRARLYWGIQRHPELVVSAEKDPENDEYYSEESQPAASTSDSVTTATAAAAAAAATVVVVGGSKSALVHEMVFCTTRNLADEKKTENGRLDAKKQNRAKLGDTVAADSYGRQFVAVYRLFMDDVEFLREFQRYSELVTPELENHSALVGNLCDVIALLAHHYEKTYTDEHIELLRTIVEKTITLDSGISKSALESVQAAIDRMVPIVIEDKHAETSEDPDGKKILTVEAGNDTVLIKSPAPTRMFSYEIVSPPVMPSTSDSTSVASKPATDDPLRARSRTHHGEPDPTVPQISSVPELVRVEITGLSPSLLLRIPPAEFAHQLYLFHKGKLAGFDPKAVNLYVSLPDTGARHGIGMDVQQTPPSLLTVGTAGAALDAEGTSATLSKQTGSNVHSHGAGAIGTVSATSGVFSTDSSGDGDSAEKLFDMQRQLMVFTHSEPHFLTRLVHHQLLIDLPLNRPARRSALLQHWVRIGEECRTIGDAVSWAAIAMAVTMTPIARLRETWHGVSLMWKDIIVSQWVPLLIKHGIYEMGADLSKDVKTSRPLIIKPHALQKGSKSGFFSSAEASGYSYAPIPYYGSVRLSIERQGRKRRRAYEPVLSTLGGGDSGDRVLFAHHGYMYTAAEEVIKGISDNIVERARNSGIRSRASSVSLATKFQRASGTCSSRASTENLRRDSIQGAIDSSLLEHPYLQSYLSTLAANPLKIGEELVESNDTEYDLRYLLSISLQCEPSASDQYRQHILQGADDSKEDIGMSLRQAPGSILPLVCPETVPSTNILQWITPAPRTPVAQAPASLPPSRASNVSGRAGTFSHASSSPAGGFHHSDGPSARPSTSSRMSTQTRSGVDQQLAPGANSSGAPQGHGSEMRHANDSDDTKGQAGDGTPDQQTLRHKRSRSFPANVVGGIHPDGAADGSGNSAQGAGSANSNRTSTGRVEQQMNDAAQSNAYFAGSTVYAANGDLSLRVLRVQYMHAREQSPSSSESSQSLRFVVEVQGGTLATLFDILINGIEHLSAGITTDKGVRIQLPSGAMPLLLFNRDVFQRIFMASFRHFCFGLDVIDAMRRTLTAIKSATWEDSTRAKFGTLLDLCENWLGNHFSDFLDSTTLRDSMAEFLNSLRSSLRKAGPRGSDANHQDTLVWKELCDRADMVCSDLVMQLLEPSGYTPLDMVLEKRAKYARNRERSANSSHLQLDVSTSSPVSLLSASTPDVILVSLNRLAQTHFARCSFNDWLVTFCLLEVQTHVPLPWYPKRRVGHVPAEDNLVVSDIYQILEQTHRAFSSEQTGDIAGTGSNTGAAAGISLSASSVETSLVRTLPQSIQSVLELHRAIRGWVIRQITDSAFILTQRVAQIQKFLTIIKLCRKDSHLSSSRVFGSLLNSYMREAGMIPDRQPSYRTNSVKRHGLPSSNPSVAGETGKRGKRRGGGQSQVKYVPSFIERAIASALVSPESRQFARAWNEVALENHTKLDTLEAVLRGARDWEAFAPLPTTPTKPTAKSSSENAGGAADIVNTATEAETSEASSTSKSKNGERPSSMTLQSPRSNPAADDIDISEDSMVRADCFVPCLGWLLENMVSLCYDTSDTLVDDSRLINLAKRHRVYIMLCICEQLGTRCQEAFALPTDIRIGMDQLSSWVLQTPLQTDELKAASQREATLIPDDMPLSASPMPDQMVSSPTGTGPSNNSGGTHSDGSSAAGGLSGSGAGDRAFSFSMPSSHTSGFIRGGDTLPSMRHMHGAGAGGFAKRSIANLRSTSGGGAISGHASSFNSHGGYGTISGASGGGGNMGNSSSNSNSSTGSGGMPVFGSPPAPIPRSLSIADGPSSGLSGSGGPSGMGIVTQGGLVSYYRPFARLVTDEIEKVRQEIRERERLERELRDREQVIERQRNERTKMLKRQLKEQQQRRAKNEPLLKMANLMNKVHSSARDSSMDPGGQGAKVSVSIYGGVPVLQNQTQDSNRMSSSSGTMRPRGPALPNAKPANVINLINSTITVEHGYTKRDFVFRIVTEEGGQYLLQAPDVEQMEDWLTAMRDAATEAAARRLTLFVEEAKRRNNADGANSGGSAAYHGGGDMDSPSVSQQQQHQNQQQSQHMPGRLPGSDTTRSRFTAFLGGSASAFGGFGLSSSQTPPVPTRGAMPTIGQQSQSKDPAAAHVEPKSFGVDLAKLMPDPKVVPTIVEKCLTEIELRGLEEIGIYRVSGAAADVSRLRQMFNSDPESIDLSHSDFHDINVVSGVMKQFLRELPEPLMTYGLYDGFINAASIDDYDERLWAIKDLVQALPAANYAVLKRLVEHLERVTDYEEVNHMYGTNLALVFGPSLLRPPPGSSSFALAMSNLGHAQSVIKNLILQYHWIFNVEEEAEPIDDGELESASAAEDGSSTNLKKEKEQQQEKEEQQPGDADKTSEHSDDDKVLESLVGASGAKASAKSKKRESVAVSPLSAAAQADMDQLAVAVNKLSV
ncbi:hypothetical protein H4217_003228 [Coemansia sp. RSA 1939]|nr:hypothetical protein H4217_003228 [Coemansia sp. RSA 1939]